MWLKTGSVRFSLCKPFSSSSMDIFLGSAFWLETDMFMLTGVAVGVGVGAVLVL